MKIQKGIVEYKDRRDLECTYGEMDDGAKYFFLDSTDTKKFTNGNRIVSTELIEAIDPMVKASHVGVINDAGEIVITCNNKSIKAIDDGTILVELAEPVSQSVIEANTLRNDPLSATKLVSTPATIKEKINAQMSSEGRYVFNDQFSEATIYDIDGNNLVNNEYYSFIGYDNNTLYMSKNTADSPITTYSILAPQAQGDVSVDANSTIDVSSVVVDQQVVEQPLSGQEGAVADESENGEIQIPIANEMSTQAADEGSVVAEGEEQASIDVQNNDVADSTADTLASETVDVSDIPAVPEGEEVEDTSEVQEDVSTDSVGETSDDEAQSSKSEEISSDTGDAVVDITSVDENNLDEKYIEEAANEEIGVEGDTGLDSDLKIGTDDLPESGNDDTDDASDDETASDESQDTEVEDSEDQDIENESSLDDDTDEEEKADESNEDSTDEAAEDNDDVVEDSSDEVADEETDEEDINIDNNEDEKAEEEEDREAIETGKEETTDSVEDASSDEIQNDEVVAPEEANNTPQTDISFESLFGDTSDNDILKNVEVKTDKIVDSNGRYDSLGSRYSVVNNGGEHIIPDTVRSMTSLINKIKEKDDVIKEKDDKITVCEEKIRKYEAERMVIAEKYRDQAAQLESLSNQCREKDSALSRADSRNRYLEERTRNQDSIIEAQEKELAVLREQVSGISDLLVMNEKVKSVIGEDSPYDYGESGGYYRRAA